MATALSGRTRLQGLGRASEAEAPVHDSLLVSRIKI